MTPEQQLREDMEALSGPFALIIEYGPIEAVIGRLLQPMTKLTLPNGTELSEAQWYAVRAYRAWLIGGDE